LATVRAAITFPCVIKPTELNGSRGVIRANNVVEFEAAQMRLMRLLRDIYPHQAVHEYLVETYIPGIEVALEGMMDAGMLHVLALFDKPDPLEGPFFEETIYVTPSRLTDAQQQQIATVTATAAQSLGIMSGPVHAELRLNDAGCFVIEIAARSIGGLCSRTLRFGTAESLEMLIVRQSVGMWHEAPARQQNAGGVMMIPIPAAGILRRVNGVAQAEQVPLIESIEITAPLHHPICMLPEGDSYLGFIFARGPHATDVEAALRQAHACLQFDIMPAIQLA
jgi:biotin carboxylase